MHEDRYVAESIAEWLDEQVGSPVEFLKVEPGTELILPEREQRELDALPSRLAN
jgi:hypothetical protein